MAVTVVNKPSHTAGRSGQLQPEQPASRAAWDEPGAAETPREARSCRHAICWGRDLFDLRPRQQSRQQRSRCGVFYGCGMGCSDLHRLGLPRGSRDHL